MSKIHYVFWDSDNTLIDSMEMHWRKHVETLKSHGIALKEEHRPLIYRNNGVQNWQWLHKELGLTLPQEEYLQQIDNWYFEHLDHIKIRDGIIESLSLINERGIRQAVISSGRKRSVMAPLTAKNLTKYMSFILCNEDYDSNKPDPAPYLAGMKRMGPDVTGEQCLAIEDDPKGVEAAKAAGMTVIHRKLSQNQPNAPLADAVCFEGETLLKQLSSYLLLPSASHE